MKRLILTICLLITWLFCNSQDNYFYGVVKIPVVDYIQYSLLKNGYGGSNTEGALFEIGYAVNTDDYFVLELGLEAFFYSPLSKRYYQSNSQNYNELNVVNKAISLQFRPILRFDLAEDTYFRIAAAFNIQKQYSSANYYQNNQNISSVVYSANARSPLVISVQPLIGVESWFNKNFGMGLDLAYVFVNWNKSMRHLNFNSMYPISIPKHQTSGVFLTGRIFFK